MSSPNHILSASQFSQDDLSDIFERADYMQAQEASRDLRRQKVGTYAGLQLISLFYEPSTRTRLSFESAGAKLGMGIISTENAREFSSASKGETLEDTIKVISGYGDVIVMRHNEDGAAAVAATVSEVPIINAGDGGNEHPTQAVLDTYTILKEVGRLDNLKIAFGGDLRFGRTVRSLVRIMSSVYKGNNFNFIAPPELQITDDIKKQLKESNASFMQTQDRYEGIEGADIIYWTRLQKERLTNPVDKMAVDKALMAGDYNLDKSVIPYLKLLAKVLHPLPRVGEITTDIDSLPQACYFPQAHIGVPIRQALIERVLG
jgi:aspartate carbamoyltransferase catalytic subunit